MDNKFTEFTEFYEKVVNDVYRYAYFKVNDRGSAEDITSEAFLRLLSSEKWEEIANKKAWVIGITRNIVFETYREKYKVDETDADPDVIETDYGLETEAITEELIQLVKDKLDKIDEPTREVIVLRVWEELQFNEIAEVMEIKESTAKLRFYRGIEKLKEIVNKQKGTKLNTIGFPMLFGAIHLFGKQPEFIPEASFTNNLLHILDTQIMDTPKPDPVKKVEADITDSPKETPKMEVPATESVTGNAASTGKMSNPFKDFKMGSFKELAANPAFFGRLLLYSAATIAVVGVVGISAANSVADNIRSQPGLAVNNNVVVDDTDESDTDEDVIPAVNTATWSTYTDTTLGYRVLHPKEYSVSEGEIAIDSTTGTTTKIGDGDFEVEFFRGDITQAGIYLAGGTPKTDTELGSFNILGKNRSLTVNSYGEGVPSDTDDCVTSGYQSNIYFVNIYEDLYATFTIGVQDDCVKEGESVSAQLNEKIERIEPTFRAMLESIKQATITTPADPYASWTTYTGKDFSIKYPEGWTATEEGNLNGATYKNLRLKNTSSNAEVVINRTNDNAFGFGPSRTYSESRTLKLGTKSFTTDFTYLQQDCDPMVTDSCIEVDSPTKLIQTDSAAVFTLVETGIASTVHDGTLKFNVLIWENLNTPSAANVTALNSRLDDINDILETFKTK